MNYSTINYQNILLDNLGQPINITFSTPSPPNSLITKCKATFTANDPHIKNYDGQTVLDYLKRQILTEVAQEIKTVIYQNVTHQVRLILYLL